MRATLARLVILLAFAGLTGLFAVAPIGSNDLWLHLKTGSLILEQGRVPHVDVYTFTRAGAPYIAHEWLVQVLFAFLYRYCGGLPALSLIYAALLGGILWTSYRSTARRLRAESSIDSGVARAATVLTTALVFYLITSALAIRPHLFTFLLAAIFSAILPSAGSDAPRKRRAALVALSALQVLWANLHGGFVIGILLAGIRLVAGTLRASSFRLVIAAAALPPALAIAACLNPYGPHLYALVWKFSDPVFRQAILEWESPFESRFAATLLFWCYLAWLAIAVAASAWLALRRREPTPAVTLLVFGAMSALSRRHIGLLAILTAPAVGLALATVLAALARRRRIAAAVAAWGSTAIVLALVATVAYLRQAEAGVTPRLGLVARNIPMEALEVMRAESLRGRVFTTLGIGSYVTWRGSPDLTTSIDSRLEVFGGEFLIEHLGATRDPNRFAAFAARWPFDFALLPWQSGSVRGALAALDGDAGWALIYFDDVAALYARRTPQTEALVARRAYRYLRPTGVPQGLAARAELSDVVREARRAAEDPPLLPGRPPLNTRALTLLRALGG